MLRRLTPCTRAQTEMSKVSQAFDVLKAELTASKAAEAQAVEELHAMEEENKRLAQQVKWAKDVETNLNAQVEASLAALKAQEEAHSVQLIPHCAYFGPGNLASIHIVASLSTDTLLENIYANLEASPYGDAMVAKDGKVRVPQGPGLGVDPDMAIVEKYRQGPAGVVTG